MAATACALTSASPMACPCTSTQDRSVCDFERPTTCTGHFCAIRPNEGRFERVCHPIDLDTDVQCGKLKGIWGSSLIDCCCHDNCTQSLTPTMATVVNSAIENTTASHTGGQSSSSTLIGVIVGVAAVLVVMAILLALFKRRRKQTVVIIDDDGDGYSCRSAGLSSGRGGGTRLMHRSMVNEMAVDRHVTLGAGGYGTVYRGTWHGREVAVKCFTDQNSFHWEHDFFNRFNMRHNAIVDFIGGDFIHNESSHTMYWLLTKYYPLGSLQLYLQQVAFGRTAGIVAAKSSGCNLSRGGALLASPSSTEADRQLKAEHRREILQLVLSLVNGLDYLHSALSNNLERAYRQHKALQKTGPPASQTFQALSKPSIAHCDLKSANILVRDDRSCCIADFGQAVYLDPDSGELQMPVHLTKQKGTNRYQAPESLTGKDSGTMRSLLQQDIYSLGLILWEVTNCVPTEGRPVTTYSPPYQAEMNKGNPSIGDVRKVVCDAAVRPPIHGDWNESETLRELASIMTSCWQAQPDKRPQSSDLARQLQLFTESPKQPYVTERAPHAPPVAFRNQQEENPECRSGQEAVLQAGPMSDAAQPCWTSTASSTATSTSTSSGHGDITPPFLPSPQSRPGSQAAPESRTKSWTSTSL